MSRQVHGCIADCKQTIFFFQVQRVPTSDSSFTSFHTHWNANTKYVSLLFSQMFFSSHKSRRWGGHHKDKSIFTFSEQICYWGRFHKVFHCVRDCVIEKIKQNTNIENFMNQIKDRQNKLQYSYLRGTATWVHKVVGCKPFGKFSWT